MSHGSCYSNSTTERLRLYLDRVENCRYKIIKKFSKPSNWIQKQSVFQLLFRDLTWLGIFFCPSSFTTLISGVVPSWLTLKALNKIIFLAATKPKYLSATTSKCKKKKTRTFFHQRPQSTKKSELVLWF